MPYNILISGSDGFIGKNLVSMLSRGGSKHKILTFVRSDSEADLAEKINQSDYIFHLAGVNRPNDIADFCKINVDLTKLIVNGAKNAPRLKGIAFSSSTQVILANPYGESKLAAENLLTSLDSCDIAVNIFRLPGVFGKWCRPNYNSVVATFCYNIARNMPIDIQNGAAPLELCYIDDVVRAMVGTLEKQSPGIYKKCVNPRYSTTVQTIADKINQIADSRNSGLLPNFSDPLNKALYATYLSYLETNDFARNPKMSEDHRGWLFELTRSEAFGQIFISTTYPGKLRGNHFHDLKTEKFCVVKGSGQIHFRSIISQEIVTYNVSATMPSIVDIPPGYAHSIQNTGEQEMIVIFWASEPFDPAKPDTNPMSVIDA